MLELKKFLPNFFIHNVKYTKQLLILIKILLILKDIRKENL